MTAKKKRAETKPAAKGLQSPAAQLVMGASAAIAGGILAGLWALKRKKS